MVNPKRLEIIEILGGHKCKHCGNEDPRVLEIDHIFGNGKEMPLSDKNIIDIYLDNPHLCITELQILCRNCHRIKSLENGDLGRRKGEPKPVTVRKEDIPDYVQEVEKNIPKPITLKAQVIPKNNLENMQWYT